MASVDPEHDALVRDCALRIARELRLKVEIGDLVGYGYQGLLEAKERYDPEQAVRFEAFAYPRVRGAILDGVRRMARHTHKVHAAHKVAAARLSRIDSAMEEAGEQHEARRAEAGGELDRSAMATAVDAMIGQLISSYVVTSVAEVERHEAPEDALITDLDIVRLRRATRSLNEHQLLLIQGLYYEERTLEEVGQELGRSKTYACRLHAEALELLRQQLG